MRLAAAHINAEPRKDDFCPGIGHFKHDFKVTYDYLDTAAGPTAGSKALLKLVE